jgi:hypothetical protein
VDPPWQAQAGVVVRAWMQRLGLIIISPWSGNLRSSLIFYLPTGADGQMSAECSCTAYFVEDNTLQYGGARPIL